MLRPVGCLAIAAAMFLTAATASDVLDWPSGGVSRLDSPDRRHTIYGEPFQTGVRAEPELWLRHAGSPERKRLLELSSTAKVFWSPDSRHFVIVDHQNSSAMSSSVYDAEGRVVLRIRPDQSDAELRAIATGHYYVEAQQFLDANTLRVAAFGHTDQAPVRCFRAIYSVTLGGRIDRISKRISPPTATTCDESSEGATR